MIVLNCCKGKKEEKKIFGCNTLSAFCSYSYTANLDIAIALNINLHMHLNLILDS